MTGADASRKQQGLAGRACAERVEGCLCDMHTSEGCCIHTASRPCCSSPSVKCPSLPRASAAPPPAAPPSLPAPVLAGAAVSVSYAKRELPLVCGAASAAAAAAASAATGAGLGGSGAAGACSNMASSTLVSSFFTPRPPPSLPLGLRGCTSREVTVSTMNGTSFDSTADTFELRSLHNHVVFRSTRALALASEPSTLSCRAQKQEALLLLHVLQTNKAQSSQPVNPPGFVAAAGLAAAAAKSLALLPFEAGSGALCADTNRRSGTVSTVSTAPFSSKLLGTAACTCT